MPSFVFVLASTALYYWPPPPPSVSKHVSVLRCHMVLALFFVVPCLWSPAVCACRQCNYRYIPCYASLFLPYQLPCVLSLVNCLVRQSVHLYEWVSEWVSGWVSGWVGEWVGGWVREWVSQPASQPVSQPVSQEGRKEAGNHVKYYLIRTQCNTGHKKDPRDNGKPHLPTNSWYSPPYMVSC